MAQTDAVSALQERGDMLATLLMSKYNEVSMQAYRFTVTINVEHPENFICDNDDIGSIVKDGIERCWGDVGKVEVESEEQE